MDEIIKKIGTKEPCQCCSKVDYVNEHGNTFYVPMLKSSEYEEEAYIIFTKEGKYELVLNGVDVNTIEITCCPVCGRKLNKPIDSKSLTNGDKIRETNETLADFIQPIIYCEDCKMDVIDGKRLCNGGTNVTCKRRILEYLNRAVDDKEM